MQIHTVELPPSVLVITCGIDVQPQAGYLAVLIMGWAPDGECWVLEWQFVPGNARDIAFLGRTLRNLHDVWFGYVPIHRLGIDSKDGNVTTYIRQAVQAAPGRGGIWAYETQGVGGRVGEPIVLTEPQSRRDRKRYGSASRLLMINADEAKQELMDMLQVKEPMAGYIHIPKRVGSEFVEQLTAEKKVPKMDPDGVIVGHVWKPTRERNEGLDCAVINLALFHSLPKRALYQHAVSVKHEDAIARLEAMYPTLQNPETKRGRRTGRSNYLDEAGRK